MAYCEVKDHFKPLEDTEIESIVQNSGNRITTNDTIDFIRNSSFTIFCIDDINKIINKDYIVKSNSYIYIHPYDMNDGYEHNNNLKISSINIESQEGTKKFIIQDTIINPLLGKVNCISDNIILVNKEDYEWIKLNGIDYHLQGTLHLYNFDNWRNSNFIVNEVWKELLQKNNLEKADKFYKISSRIEAYNTALKSSNFLLFMIIYVCALLYFAAIIMIHFKLQMEFNDEKTKYFSLYRIGIQEIEIKKMICQKILMIYSISFVYAILISIAYSYYTNSSYGYGDIGILYDIIASLVFLIIHLIVYKLYLSTYYKKIISELSLN